MVWDQDRNPERGPFKPLSERTDSDDEREDVRDQYKILLYYEKDSVITADPRELGM